jgi:hypothetical protein
MSLRTFALCAAGVVLLAACQASLRAQTAPAPTAYTVTSTSSMMVEGQVTKTSRLGSKALVEQFNSTDPKAPHTRSLNDLAKHTNLTWSLPDFAGGCGTGAFSGDWGDPFVFSASLLDDLNKQNPKQVGTETVHGFAARILEAGGPDGKTRVWVDNKYGLLLKAQSIPPNGAPRTLIEVTEMSFAPPPASVFAIPAACAADAAAPPPLTEAELIAAETGDSAANYVNAIYGPGSKNSCSVVLRVVRAKSMTPIVNRLQVAIDTTYNVDNPPHYVYGMGTDGSQTFSGGGVHEITNQIRNGMVRIDNPPAYFNLGVNLMKPGTGASVGLIYRQCFAPTTVLLYVVKDAENPDQGGDWLWVKSGKYATVPH